jgi:hypothetical protein
MRHLKVLLLIIAISFFVIACGDGDGGNGGSDPALLVGTWDMTEENGNAVPSGTVTLVLTSTTYNVTSLPDCVETGTYTANSITLTATVGTAVGTSCSSSPGNVDVMQYNVNSTNLTITHSDGDTQIWQKI